MGLDVSLLIGHLREINVSLHSKLDFDRDYRLFDLLIPELTVCPPEWEIRFFNNFADDGVILTKDRYDQLLKYTMSRALKGIEFPSEVSRWNAAIIQFLKVMPDDKIVVFYQS